MTYIAIDMDNLVVLHKHHDHEVVSALSWLEAGTTRSVLVTAIDRTRFAKNLSALELRKLYKNTTGGTLSSDDPVELRYQFAGAAQLLPATRAVREEVLAQVAEVDNRIHAGETFKYVFGSRTPAQPGELFPLKGRQLTEKEIQSEHLWAKSSLPEDSANAPTGPWPKRKEPEQAEATVTEDSPHAPAVVAERKSNRRAGATSEVRARAQAAWEAAGSPTDPEQVKQLWNGLVKPLVEEGFNKTTCRIQLANWARERLGE